MSLVNFALYNDAEPQKIVKKKQVEEKEFVCILIELINSYYSQ